MWYIPSDMFDPNMFGQDPDSIEAKIIQAGQALEWPRLLNMTQTEARTEPAKAMIGDLLYPAEWAQDIATARHLQQETHEVSALLDRDALWGPLTELNQPFAALESLKRGAVLEVLDLGLIRRWIYAVESWTQVPREDIRGELFKRALLSLADPFEPLRILERVLTPDGELSEKASPKLGTLYTEIRSLKREISIILDQLIKTFSQKGVLQENFTDVRDGRYVLPIKIAAQGEVDGIIYEASASRQTVFVEPKEVAPLNNRLRQRQNELIQEIYIVLADTSKKLQPFAEELEGSVQILAHWDAVQAKARVARHYGGKAIQVTDDRGFRLRSSAHPLLWWSLASDQIIRNEIDFGDPVRTLLLTGPNTGGKTVLLKTLGLAGICARTGLMFPATDQPIIPFFDAIFADLGDPQSIEQHLSSFSGHLLRFKGILEKVTDRSLVLIDELNAATDPEEGAALGRAILETIMSRGAMIITTTHDPHLKTLAVSDQRILNASMAFDETARTPSYRMIVGVPGRSRALETAERLGMPESVITLARSYLSHEHKEFERLLKKLETDTHETGRARKEAVTIREEAERMKKEWTERTESSVNEMLERTRQKLRRILETAQDEVRTSVRKLDETRSRREIDQTRGQLNEAITQASTRVESALAEEAPELAETITIKESAPPSDKTAEIFVGATVRIPKWKNTGTVLEIKGNKVKVSMGTLQMSLALTDVESLTAGEAAQIAAMKPGRPQPPGKFKMTDMDAPPAPPPQIDLRGTRFDEAMSSLGQYLDQAFRSGSMAEVTVIHGLGSGALREGTRKVLADLPYVKNFRDGGPGHGGTGATIVEFARD